MNRRAWARLALDAAAGGWTVALALAVSAWMGMPVPLWLLASVYTITALGRRLSRAMGLAALVLCCAAAAFSTGWPESAMYVAASLTVACQAQSLPRSAPYHALRTQFALGMNILLVVGMIRVAQGRPPIAEFVGPALALISAGLFGLPYVHSLDALGDRQSAEAAAKPGLRLGGLILLVGVAFGLIVGMLGILDRIGVLSNVLALILQAIALVLSLPGFLLFSVIPVKGHLRFPAFKSLNPIHSIHSIHHVAALSPGTLFWLHFVEAAILLLAAAGVVFYLYRRQRDELEQNGEENVPRASEVVSLERILPSRRGRLDFGIGARALVRAAVARHLLRNGLRPSETARQIAAREGWPEEVLDSYERARYRLEAHFDDKEASRFVFRLREWSRRRRHRRSSS